MFNHLLPFLFVHGPSVKLSFVPSHTFGRLRRDREGLDGRELQKRMVLQTAAQVDAVPDLEALSGACLEQATQNDPLCAEVRIPSHQLPAVVILNRAALSLVIRPGLPTAVGATGRGTELPSPPRPAAHWN